MVSAAPTLREVADAVDVAGLEAIMIGNAGAALLGARVTTEDFDFMIRESPVNLRKLRRVADRLGAVLFQPCRQQLVLRVGARDRGSLRRLYRPGARLHGQQQTERVGRALDVSGGKRWELRRLCGAAMECDDGNADPIREWRANGYTHRVARADS